MQGSPLPASMLAAKRRAPQCLDALDAYEDQKVKITNAIQQLEQNVRDSRNVLSSEAKIKIQNELEKFRLKMEILQIRYELGRLDLKDNVESKKQKFKKV